jgi:UDP-glucose:(heptosyl)LPS alpha-1,3-glucosyltransferase
MVKQELVDNFSLDKSKIHVLHNGVEWQAMEKDFQTWVEKKPKIAKELGLNPLDYHFLFIGHGFKRKGLGLLLLALARLKNQKFHLSIVGEDKNLKSFKEMANRLGLSSCVTFFQQRSDVRKFYQICDALIVPSLYDPFANVTVELLGSFEHGTHLVIFGALLMHLL